MDITLHKKHNTIHFQPEVIQMFADIVEADESTRKILLFIGKMEKQRKTDNSSFKGITIKEIVENVEVERKTKIRKKQNSKYEVTKTNLHRKTAEHQIDKLSDMSLLFHESIKPYKLLFLTGRGWQVIEELVKRRQK
ncbi:hypothetical protein EKG37_17580 [Robertmurraya yapensis]|uniref:Uncharacterized protein n=2 Tax=Bacillaceae TaxID=186817 RepID=A0A431VY56_9BACI|nr:MULTISPECIES: hypothetical protein [Bacillaceae]RTR28115.1 hypothetical protein EKG37_17580 [Bacillus yapensis]TKC15164.1 hypothetical protein FA727_19990 [Robertmurraya kyonggiensis]TKS94357.1 hypothetical protein FAR12_17580 [Bacillus yapensis]